jgi:AhpD family alkylhydroperoxidase
VASSTGSAVAKRTLTPDNIARTTVNCAFALPVIVRSVFRPKTSKALREKVMLGVTAINDSRYCAWGHSHWATSQGVAQEGIDQILAKQDDSPGSNDPAEAAAILFGQGYARHSDEIDPDAMRELRRHFSQGQAREIVGYVFFITFTNLSGNTVDLLVDRARGRGRAITLFEGVVGAVLAPVLFVLLLLVKLGKIVGTDKRRAKRNRPSQDVPPDGASAGAV